MADWSQLPPELLLLIGKRLEVRFDVLRFRSVCSSWRSSVSPKVDHFLLPTYLPSGYRYYGDDYRIRISRNTCYLIRLSDCDRSQAPTCWLVKISDGADRLKMQLLDPFSDYNAKSLPENFPKVLDLANFQVFELDHAYIGHFKAERVHPLASIDRDYWTKVVWLQSCTDDNDLIILTSFWCLAAMRSGDEEWTLLENVKGVDDIISFNGKFYVAEREGRTIVIDQSLNISFLGCVGSGRRRGRKYLVRSVDDLLAVEMLHDTYQEDPITLCDQKLAGFKVFKMNEEEHKWEEMESLRDRIVFLSDRQAISAPASEFCWGKGNLIFFHSTCFPTRGHVCVFDLETGTASPLENCPAYSNLFWPPPQWVTSPESMISSTRVISNSAHSMTSSPPETECKYPESNFTTTTTASSAGKVDSNFPMVLDLNNFQVIELGHEYIARSRVFVDHRIMPQSWDYIEKVVYLRSSADGDSFTMLGFILHFPKCLAFLRSGEKDWTLLEAADDVRDIVSFNGKFYAIEQKGRTMVIDQSLNVSFLEHVGSSSSIMFLVKCVDNLLAVEMIFDTDAENTSSYGTLVREKAVGFKVFKMNEEEQRWDEMESLRDQILFLGFHQAISAPAFEFGWGRGNLIFFSECVPGHDTSEDRLMFVFDLETGTASPLENCPAYCNLFWPPPQRVASPTEDITDSTHSVTSTSPETECKYPESDLAISTTASSAGKIDSEHPSPMSKCSFKFCCF
ncbi:hypothetical protein GQ457_10G024880 [Hibiscus cannabinus]